MNAPLGKSQWQEAHDFWFVELRPKQWFVSSAQLDRTITERFASTLESLANNSHIPPVTTASLAACHIHTAQDTLAAILVTDQFSRNIHRGSAAAFATDALALALSEHLVATDVLQDFTPAEAQFALMPFMHAETMQSQDISVNLFTQFDIEQALPSAIEHRELIRRFGRFPHRNELLGRESTAQEKDYLKTGKTFGQG